MKYAIVSLLFLLCFTVQLIYAQYPQGTVVTDHLYSELLENSGGEDPTRRITVYLPPGYEESDQRYPVIYYLHGFPTPRNILATTAVSFGRGWSCTQ